MQVIDKMCTVMKLVFQLVPTAIPMNSQLTENHRRFQSEGTSTQNASPPKRGSGSCKFDLFTVDPLFSICYVCLV